MPLVRVLKKCVKLLAERRSFFQKDAGKEMRITYFTWCKGVVAGLSKLENIFCPPRSESKTNAVKERRVKQRFTYQHGITRNLSTSRKKKKRDFQNSKKKKKKNGFENENL